MRYTIQRSHESSDVSAVDDKRWQQSHKHLHQAFIPQHKVADAMLRHVLLKLKLWVL